jgi:hypothetical protein
VKPGHPFERAKFDGFAGLPRSAPMNQLSLVKPFEGFGQGVIVAVAFASNGCFNAVYNGRSSSMMSTSNAAASLSTLSRETFRSDRSIDPT